MARRGSPAFIWCGVPSATPRHIGALAAAVGLVALAAASAADDRPAAPPPKPAEEPEVRVDLLAEHTTVRPGTSASFALRFVLRPGWHVYWQNPGDAGLAPTAKWTLPDGYRAGALRFPVPRRHEDGPVVTFIHEGEVVLPFEIEVPATAAAGTQVTVTADVSSLVCSDVCIPAQQTVRAELRVAKGEPEPVAAVRSVFTAARAALPKRVAEDVAQAVRSRGKIVLDLSRAGIAIPPEASAEFFPSEDGVVTFAAARRDGAKIVLTAKRDEPAAGERLRGVIVIATEKERTGHEIDVPIAADAGDGPSKEAK